MIYANNKDWKPSKIPLGKQNLSLLNVSCLQNLEIHIQRRAKQIEQDSKKLKQKLQDAIIDVSGLKNKVDTIILPYSCFKRPFSPLYDLRQNKQEQITPYEHLVKTYGVQFPIGVSIPLDTNSLEHQDFIQDFKTGKFKYIRVINFNLHSEQLGKQFPVMRKIVNSTFDQTKKIKCHYNINVVLKNGSQFASIRKELLTHQYPIEYFAVTHNLINLFPCADQYQILYKMNQIINKTLPCCLINVIETYYPSYYKQKTKFQSIQQELQFFYKTISILNKKSQSGQKSYKKAYNSGIAIPECLFVQIIRKFNFEDSDHFMVKAEMDRLGFDNANSAILGNYKQRKQTNYT